VLRLGALDSERGSQITHHLRLVTNHCFSIRNQGKMEIAVSHRKQRKAANSNRNFFRGSGELLYSKKMTKMLAKAAAVTLRINNGRLRLGLGTGPTPDPNRERLAPGSRRNQHRRCRLRDRHSCPRTNKHRSRRSRRNHHNRRNRHYCRNRIRVSSSPGRVGRSQENRSQERRSRVRRNCQKLAPGQASPGKMKMRHHRTRIPARSRSSIHRLEIRGHRDIHDRLEIRGGRRIPDARTERCATRIVNSRMRIGSWRNCRIECDLYSIAHDS